MPPSPFLKAIRETAEYLGKKLDKVLAAVKDIKVPPPDNRAVVGAINRLGEKIKEPSFTVSVDTTLLEDEVQQQTKALKSLKFPDNKGVETMLSNILVGQNSIVKALTQLSTDIKGAFSSINLKVPDTIKLDDMQVRAISSSRMPLNPAPLAPRTTNVRNVAMASANTEYSITLSAGTTGYFIKLRAQNVQLLLATATGKLPTSGDGTAYFSVAQNGYLSPMGMDVGGKTLYLQAGSASQVCEVTEFIA